MSELLYINGKRLVIDQNRAIGSGGEGEVWDIGGGVAAKVFKTPGHPDYAGTDPQSERDRLGAGVRLELLQRKLPVFPRLPGRVVTPQDLIRTKQGQIRGYTMQFLQGAEVLKSYTRPGFRNTAGIDNNAMQSILLDLYDLVSSVHRHEVQIGDFNILGVLVLNGNCYLIDADSFQFGGFMCRSFTPRFVDPLVCKKDELVLAKDFSEKSDWYAFSAMAFETLTHVPPYGGVLKGTVAKGITQDDRPLYRVSVLHKDVTYPTKGTPLDRFSDDFLHYYERLLHGDERGDIQHDCFVMRRDGTIAADQRAKEGADSWLDGFMGKAAISLSKGDGVTHALLSIGDSGMFVSRSETDPRSKQRDGRTHRAFFTLPTFSFRQIRGSMLFVTTRSSWLS